MIWRQAGAPPHDTEQGSRGSRRRVALGGVRDDELGGRVIVDLGDIDDEGVEREHERLAHGELALQHAGSIAVVDERTVVLLGCLARQQLDRPGEPDDGVVHQVITHDGRFAHRRRRADHGRVAGRQGSERDVGLQGVERVDALLTGHVGSRASARPVREALVTVDQLASETFGHDPTDGCLPGAHQPEQDDVTRHDTIHTPWDVDPRRRPGVPLEVDALAGFRALRTS